MIRLAKFFGSMLVLLVMCSFVFLGMPKAFGTLQFEDGKIRVDVYVIALTGVEARGVDNATKIIEGVQKAVNVVNERNFTSCSWSDVWYNVSSRYFFVVEEFILGTVYIGARFPVNITIHEVHEWNEYKNVIETHSECVVINAYGSVIPVPSGYTKEAWVDKIAEAMLYRNLTWVHVAGYPFYHAWYEGASDKETWGEAGFQQLMQHINKPNITIQHPSPDYNRAGISEAELYWMKTWPEIYQAKAVSIDYPLLDSDFDVHIALPIWRSDGYNAGAVIAFKKTANDTSCGFYVHIGTSQTFNNVLEPTDADLYRGYIGCVASLWSLVSRTGRETLIAEAEALIEKALEDGRTEGLSEAYESLESAEYFHNNYGDAEFLRDVYHTMVAAIKAEKPDSDLLPQLLFMSLGVGSVVIIGAVVWHKRRKENDEEG